MDKRKLLRSLGVTMMESRLLNISRLLATMVVLPLLLFSASAQAADAPAVPSAEESENDAKSILKVMSDYVGSQNAVELAFDSSIEIITPQLEKIQFTNSGSAVLSRPDKFRGHRIGGNSDVELFFDGKVVSIFDHDNNGYARFSGPTTIDQLIATLRAGHGVAFPGADFLLSQSYDVLIADVLEAKYIGRGMIDGHLCEHLAFRNFDTDWQLWVEAGENPIPRKFVITSKTMNSAPQYSVRIKEWKTGVKTAQDAFDFVPPEGAKALDPNALIHLDELPGGTETGEPQ